MPGQLRPQGRLADHRGSGDRPGPALPGPGPDLDGERVDPPGGDPARGVFAVAFRDRGHGIAVGGDYRPDQASPKAAAVTGDGGRSWQASATPPPAYRSGVTWLPHTRSAALAVGPTGTDLTLDGGRTWRTVDSGSYDTVDCTRDLGCWAAGEKGRVARLGF